MVSPVLIERRHSFGFLVSEEEQGRSRDQVVLLQQTPAAAPSAPSLSAGTSGSLPTSTIYCKVTYVGAFGETLPSAEASQAVTGPNGDVVVTAPSTVAGATGWNLYASSASGGEFLQNAVPNALGSNFTINSLVVGGVSPPTVAPSTELPAGLILGQTLVGTSATYTANSGNTGNFTCGTVTVAQGAIEGTYMIEFIAATVFNVQAPNGVEYEGHTGVAFSAGGLGFTITAGGTAAVAGDGATIALATNANAGLYAPLNLSAADGTQTAAAILANEIDASSANTKVTVIDRAAQVNGSELIYPAAATAAQITAINATLATIGVIVR
jgi:hypothetical protein